MNLPRCQVDLRKNENGEYRPKILEIVAFTNPRFLRDIAGYRGTNSRTLPNADTKNGGQRPAVLPSNNPFARRFALGITLLWIALAAFCDAQVGRRESDFRV